MDALDLARWQFGIVTVFHFLFVPITLGLSMLVAGLQTAWVRTGKDVYLQATKFWGKLFLINFAIGVVTGIVQEFQFGMNWSEYSRYVGDIFGAPLAMEGLLAFFLESTFLGLWIFGWDRLPKRVHLATIWLAAIGTNISAYFILAANSWMQHPSGYRVDVEAGRAEMTNIFAVLFQKTAFVTFGHTMTAAFLTAGTFMLGISVWHLVRGQFLTVMRTSMKLGAITVIVGALGVAVSGHFAAQVMTQQQPMKMAAAEAAWNSKANLGFSLFTLGSLDGSEEVYSIRVPGLASFLATNNFNGTVEGLNDIQAAEEQQFGQGVNYKPNIPVTYWSFRLMIGWGALAAMFAATCLWLFRRGRTVDSRWLGRLAIAAIFMPLLANSFGWIFTEMGRQPWSVYGLLLTANGISLAVSSAEVWISMITLTLLYGVLAVIEVGLTWHFAKVGPPDMTTSSADEIYDGRSEDKPLTFAY
ncbi:MAG: cytochrome ubiquinol oxidase subunit I [Actinomycetes bacterium]